MIKTLIGTHIWTVAGAVLLFLILYIFHIDTLNTFSAISYGIFYLITVFTMIVAIITYDHPNAMLFGNAVLAMMMLKLIVTPFVIIWYIKSNEEISRLILLPFFFSYLWFTVYEMYYLLKKEKES